MCFALSGGQRHESRFLAELMQKGTVGRTGAGRPRLRPERVAADKGYSYPSLRAYLRRRGIGAVIPTRSDQRRSPRFDGEAYRERNAVERAFGRLKQFRRIATRYEKLASSYLAMLTLAAIRMWL
jgi:transposase